MKISNIFYIIGLFTLLILPSCEDGWTGKEVIIEELTIANGDYVGCSGDSVQLWALDQNGDTTTNVKWYSSNGSVIVNSSGIAILYGGGVSEYNGASSAHIIAKSVADNVTSEPIKIESDNPSVLDQITDTWLAKQYFGDTVGVVSTNDSYTFYSQKLTINNGGTWSGEIIYSWLSNPDSIITLVRSGYYEMDTATWYGYNTSDSTRYNLLRVTKLPETTYRFSSYCTSVLDGSYNEDSTGTGSCQLISENNDTTYYSLSQFRVWCGTLGDQDGTVIDNICTYTYLDSIDTYTWQNVFPSDTTSKARIEANCSLTDTLGMENGWYPWAAYRSIRQ